MKIGIIGLGNMGGSLARLVAQDKRFRSELLLANRSRFKAEKIAAEVGGQPVSNKEVFAQAEVIFLGIKPAQFADLLAEYQEVLEKRESLLLISIAAGLTLETLGKWAPSHHRWIRMMPNTPVAVGEGVISFALSQQANQADEDLLCELLSSAGLLVKLEEKQLDAATALAGCGPAFVYLFIEALADAGVRVGLSRDISLQLANQTLLGAVKLSQVSGQHPALLKDQVCSPAGSTIAGVASLEENAFRGTVMDAVQASYKRTQELGK
ncbi:pyrroline-5-carboxylate reductase [Streptococcus sanguinis SK1057]|uniref:pyrroline-5-carboxylate reductase n=1 Tax=Streptococcus sanguinis TaxID=1305 RepID=UPI000204ED05|nr:pyrroline-5-carboxylate reductase [Streptococcus sanguinis]EGF06791.1 pyrroline-5-carboxylate reductase [Streptococcus sanguinis SK1057]